MGWDTMADLGYQEKQLILAEYWARFGPFPFLIETGVWEGRGSLMQLAGGGAEYVAVELERGSAETAWARGWDVRVGDSAELLPGILAARDGPAFFWLDAHLVNEVYELNGSPLEAEIEAIVAWPYAAGSVVLIDDVRMMGREGWPSVRGLLERAYVEPGLWDLELADDIVRLTPRSP
jgi:hypothetical protein